MANSILSTEIIQKPITTTEFAYNTIKDWIITGRCTPGEHINQDDFAKTMGVSRIPIRSALDKLAAEGLVVIQPRKGAIVTQISVDNLTNIFNLRCYLEPIAVLEAMEKSSPEEIRALRGLLDSQDHVSDDIEIRLNQNRNFHFAIFSLTKNDTLIGALYNLWEQSDRYRRIYFAKSKHQERIVKDHFKIVELLCAGKKQGAADKIALHVRESLNILLEDIFGKSASSPFVKIQSLG
ncbi:MAG: GntR family transcriptional regulator [Treponema sp.]|nr:GntR family transcriptional regulator [Treponema sp.]